MRIWIIICALFFLNSILILIKDKNGIAYKLDKFKSKKDHNLKYSICINLNNLTNQTEINLTELDLQFKDYLNRSIESKNLIQRIIKYRKFYIFKHLFCLIISSKNLNNLTSLIGNKNRFVFIDYEFFKLKKSSPLFNLFIISESKCRPIDFSNRFLCLMNCIKKYQNLSKYYYNSNEIGIIKLKYNQTDDKIKKNELHCSTKCKIKDEDCKLIYFKPKYNDDQSYISVVQAYPLISEFNYWTQLIGLICFFTDLCCYQLSIRLINYIKSKFKIIKIYKYKINVNRICFYLKFLIILIWSIFLSILFAWMIIEYLNRRDQPIKKQITTTLFPKIPKQMQLVICRNMDQINIDSYSKIKKDTSIKIDDLFIKYRNKKIKVNLKIRSKIYFYKNNQCFLIDLLFKEFRYQSLLAISKLIIKFNQNTNYSVYLLPDHVNWFNPQKSYLFKRTNLFILNKIKRSKLNQNKRCSNYDQNLKCFSKWNCIDYCINRKFINKYNNLSWYSLIDKDHFTDKEWNSSLIDFDFNNFNRIKEDCYNEFKFKFDCIEMFYKKSILLEDNFKDKLIKIQLYHDLLIEIEEEPSIYKLLIDLLNIQSILFGLNILKFMFILFNYYRIKFKFNKLLIYLLCLIGFSYHLWFIFDEIINGELIYSQYYKLEQSLEMRNLIVCLNYNQQLIDNNYKLNFEYLDKITNRMDYLIDNIFYLDNFNKWNKFNKSNNVIKVRKFFFLQTKCYEFQSDIEYQRNQFDFKDNDRNEIIKIFLNKQLINNSPVYFITNTRNLIEFSKINRLILKKTIDTYQNYIIEQELFEIHYNDKFEFIKNPFSFLNQHNLNDANYYLNNLIINFKQIYNLATLNLPLYKSNLLIEDQLFDQFYIQIENQTNQIPKNYNKNFMINRLEIKNQSVNQSADISFNLIFFKKIIKITNEDNYSKLILNLLNLISLWFGIGIFDLNQYLDLIVIKIKSIFICIYKLLLTIRIKLANF